MSKNNQYLSEVDNLKQRMLQVKAEFKRFKIAQYATHYAAVYPESRTAEMQAMLHRIWNLTKTDEQVLINFEKIVEGLNK